MMAFQLARGGYWSMVTSDESELICGLIRDVVYILGSDVEDELQRLRDRAEFFAQHGVDFADQKSEMENLRNSGNDAGQNVAFEEDFFAMLEEEFATIEERVEDETNDRVFILNDAPAQQDDALARLLPDMSEDPNIATELRNLTEESISLAKIKNLVQMYQVLHKIVENTVDSNGFMAESADSKGELQNENRQMQDFPADFSADFPENQDAFVKKHYRVFILNDEALDWMAAMNDIRLVLATRLEIDNDEISESVYERSQLFTSHSPNGDENMLEIDSPEDMMMVLYVMLSWWQDSLVNAVRNKDLRR